MAESAGHKIAGEAMARVGAAVASERAAAAGEQLPLFPLPTRLEGEAAEQLQAAAAARHGPGRPPGAENYSNRRLREYLLARGVNPLASMMQWSLHSPHSLARELGCTPLEALRELRMLWGELAPFFVPKLALVDDTGKPVPVLQMMIGQTLIGAAGGQAPWEIREAIQGLADSSAEATNGAATNGAAK